jgi:ATP diphosphatase
MAEEIGAFAIDDVMAAICAKMIRRHPHIFGDAAHSPGWESLKAAERHHHDDKSALAGIAQALPALKRAEKLQRRAARVGFDWPDAGAVLEKLDEEVAELRAELGQADPVRLTDEVGDLLFVLANLARKLNLDPEACLRHANQKFTRRFQAMEQRAEVAGNTLADMSLEEMEALWQFIKENQILRG